MVESGGFEAVLGYTFSDSGLLKQALTHRSAGAHNNERLEFLGDSVLGFLVAENLYARFATASEGQLSRVRSAIVKEDSLARVARSMNLGQHIRLGSGELKSGGFNRDSILADAVEAILGAVYLDGGPESARRFVERHFQQPLAGADPEKMKKDPKTRLQEHLQKQGLSLPAYIVDSISGASHNQMFQVRCVVSAIDTEFPGQGSSKRKAEQAAAAAALAAIGGVEQ